jgi:hypothetical protein
MAELRATPYANPLTGLSNDAIQGLLAFMQDKRRTQQLQGLGNLLESTGIPKTVERAAYAESPRGLLDALTNVNRANVPLLKPETAESLLTLSPVPSGAGRAAMAAGRAGERVAERVVPQILERGGVTAGLLQDLAQGTTSKMASIPAFHGTNIEKIGMPNAKMSEIYDRTHFSGWFSENPELSNYYAVARNEGNPNVLPVILDIKKPLKLNFDMNSRADEAYKAAEKLGLDPDFFDEIKDKNWAHEVVNTYTFKKAAQEAGYDAIQVFEDGFKTYAPLKEGGKQIKSRFE